MAQLCMAVSRIRNYDFFSGCKHWLSNSSHKVDDEEPDLHYPGLVNISGTYCFLNSVLQVCIERTPVFLYAC